MGMAFLIVGIVALLIVERAFVSEDVPIRGGHGDRPTGSKPEPTPRPKR